MQLLSLILLVLTIWWIAFALAVAADKSRKTRELARAQQKPSPVPPDLGQHPRWPSWSEYRARPSLFLIIPWCALLYGVVFVFIWPAIPIHKFWLWTLRKKSEDHAG
jgi:hypothetical protein